MGIINVSYIEKTNSLQVVISRCMVVILVYQVFKISGKICHHQFDFSKNMRLYCPSCRNRALENTVPSIIMGIRHDSIL